MSVDPLLLAVELAFVVLFVLTLIQYVRRRDPVSRAVALTFSSVTALFLMSLAGRVAPLPQPVTLIVVVLFFLQPIFTLHLVSLVRHIPRWVLVAAVVATLATVLPTVLVSRPPTVVAFAALGVFAAVELVAGVYLLLAAQRRRGPIRARLTLAAISTALFAAAILVAVAVAPASSGSTGSPGSGAASGTSSATAVLALLAALGYLVAFVPPHAVQRVWQADTAVEYMPQLIADAGAPVADIWRRYADLAAAMFDGHAAVVMPIETGVQVIASGRFPSDRLPETTVTPTREGFAELLSIADRRPARPPAAAGPLGVELAQLVGARFIRVVRVPLHGAHGDAALAILSTHRTLFHPSDHDLLGSLGAQTAVIAERRILGAEQEALANRLAASVEALRDASKAKSDFLASMSHELRTPLSAILGFSELMRLEPRDNDTITVPADWVDHIQRGGEHLLGLINDVLDLSKVEAGRLELRPESLDASAAIAESLAGLRPLAERKRLQLSAAAPSISVRADKGRLRQILYNLLSNAIKYTPDGGAVRVEAMEANGEVRIAVIDTGVGIAPEDQAAVFEEFRQVGDPAERQAGTGLGLALTRRLVEAHGGRIELESARGKGTTFTVTLPAGAPRASVDRSTPSLPRPTVELNDVLVIEDDPSAVRLLREYLEPAGYAVRVAADGETGLAMAAERRPSAIVLDVLLPGIDGWEALRRLKANAALADVPVIMLTVVDERDVGLALGAADYFVKPIQRSSLIASLSRFAPRPSTAGTPLRVLAVDDERAALDLIRSALEREGYTVETATSGEEALDVVNRARFDLVVCDLVMPGLDGFDLIAALKRDPQTASVPVLVCTGRDLSERDKTRLNGQIMGIVSKGADGRDGLRAWLSRAAQAPAPHSALGGASGAVAGG